MSKKVAICQSNYIPWKGYFDMINRVDEFVLLDDVQYTRRDWRNRNRIKTSNGLRWLTVPVVVKGKYHQKIKDTRISDPRWAEQHLTMIRHSYSRAPYFTKYEDFLTGLYTGSRDELLSRVNERFLSALCRELGISTRLSFSMDYELATDKSERLLGICQQLGATEYVSGPAARGYLDTAQFNARGIDVSWMDYTDYPEYNQLYPPFEHAVSIIDLLLNEGPNACRYLKSFCDRGQQSADSIAI